MNCYILSKLIKFILLSKKGSTLELKYNDRYENFEKNKYFK